MLEFLEAPAYDYITGIFKEHPELIWTFLSGYTMENARMASLITLKKTFK